MSIFPPPAGGSAGCSGATLRVVGRGWGDRLRPVPESACRLVLFDIDGTLISTGGRAGTALEQALLEVCGVERPVAPFRYSGKTDPQIVYELAALGGLDRAAVAPRIDRVFESYLAKLARVLEPSTVRVLPGVAEWLAELATRDDCRVGLLTGNVRPGAEIKLKAAGLWESFAVGAFGSDDENRDRLVPVARRRARERWGEEFDGQLTVVIGDAEADVRCARAADARAIAVASGWTSREVLGAMGPDLLLTSLAEMSAAKALFDGGG